MARQGRHLRPVCTRTFTHHNRTLCARNCSDKLASHFVYVCVRACGCLCVSVHTSDPLSLQLTLQETVLAPTAPATPWWTQYAAQPEDTRRLRPTSPPHLHGISLLHLALHSG